MKRAGKKAAGQGNPGKICGGETDAGRRAAKAGGAPESPEKCAGKDSARPVAEEGTLCTDPGRSPLILPSVLFGGLGAVFYLFGGMLEEDGYLSAPSGTQLALMLLHWLLFSLAAALLWAALDGRIHRPHGGRRAPDPLGKPSLQVSSKGPRDCLGSTGDEADTQSRFRAACAAWDAMPERRKNLAIWLILMGIDLVSLLAVYPGFFVYDAAEELAMVQTRNFSTHHPLLHVLLLGGVIQAVHRVSGSYNAGIFIYLLLQMAVILAAFTYLLADIRRRGAGRGLRIFSFFWLILCPTVTMFVLCSCKDGLFSAALLVMTVELRRMFTEPETFLEGKKGPAEEGEDAQRKKEPDDGDDNAVTRKRKGRGHRILFVLAAAAMMLLRNNGVYAYAVFLVIAAIAVAGKAVFNRLRKSFDQSGQPGAGKEKSTAEKDNEYDVARKRRLSSLSGGGMLRVLTLLAVPLVVFFLVNAALITATNADTSESQEILTVPLMQLARTWNSDPDSFAKEEQLLMEELMEEGGWEAYDPNLSDQMKARFRSEIYRKKRGEFWHMWLRQALLHPMTYLNAWLMTSYGFWYPEAVIDCYEGNVVYTYTYGESSYFGYETEPPGERTSLIPALDAWYEFLSLDARAQTVPVLHYVLSPGALFWVFAFSLASLLRRGQLRTAAAYLPILLVWMTVLLGPCTLPRYVVYLWFGLPMFVSEIAMMGDDARPAETTMMGERGPAC